MRFCTLLIAVLFSFAQAQAADKAPSVTPFALTAADHAQLDRVQAYLNRIHSVSADFTQVSPSGDVSGGKFYLERPGQLRMEYNPPTPVLMVSSGHSLVYYDKELDQITYIPLSSTLVGFLARDKIEFDNTITITDVESADDTLRVSLVQSKRPGDGMLTLEFSDKPLALRNMIVTDSGGQTTTVSLSNARFDVALSPELFIFKDPHPDRRHSIQK